MVDATGPPASVAAAQAWSLLTTVPYPAGESSDSAPRVVQGARIRRTGVSRSSVTVDPSLLVNPGGMGAGWDYRPSPGFWELW